jgi:hypothetical protein
MRKPLFVSSKIILVGRWEDVKKFFLGIKFFPQLYRRISGKHQHLAKNRLNLLIKLDNEVLLFF